MKKLIILTLTITSLVACSSSADEGGEPITQKPANFQGQEGSSANSGAPAQADAGQRGVAPPAGL